MGLIYNNKNQNKIRKRLRKESPRAEQVLWQYLKNKKVHNQKFRRQASIGKYVVDFYCPKLKLVIEVDGGSHTATKKLEDKDKSRQKAI
ncbi:DUF559 domain-containing protein, partial [Candidatus Falkowbacteria bacterium]|nr:DUF559 domain-containing protein [Candidatus Falkowbacteria bacterium]